MMKKVFLSSNSACGKSSAVGCCILVTLFSRETVRIILRKRIPNNAIEVFSSNIEIQVLSYSIRTLNGMDEIFLFVCTVLFQIS